MKYSTESNLFRNNSEKKDKKIPIQKKLYKNTFKSILPVWKKAEPLNLR